MLGKPTYEELEQRIAELEKAEGDRKRAEEALRKAYDELKEKGKQLVEAERLGALGEMANRVAHELRNPLTVVGGFARRIYEKIPDDDPNKKYLKIIVEEVIVLENKVSEVIKTENEL